MPSLSPREHWQFCSFGLVFVVFGDSKSVSGAEAMFVFLNTVYNCLCMPVYTGHMYLAGPRGRCTVKECSSSFSRQFMLIVLQSLINVSFRPQDCFWMDIFGGLCPNPTVTLREHCSIWYNFTSVVYTTMLFPCPFGGGVRVVSLNWWMRYCRQGDHEFYVLLRTYFIS